MLATHPAIAEAVAIGVPSELTEEDVMAVSALKSVASIDGEDVKGFGRERAARFMVPDRVEFVDEIPKTPTGKPEKFKLIAAAAPARRHDSHTGSY